MKTNKIILDACCGGRMFWFDHNNPNALYVDKRVMERQVIWRSKDGKQVREFEVRPDVVADFQQLLFEDNTFFHIVFDPPHLTKAGETSWLAKKYGFLTENWREVLTNGFNECWRVLKPYGTLIFKWNEENVKVSEVLNLFKVSPLYGHQGGKCGKTHWLAFVKIPE